MELYVTLHIRRTQIWRGRRESSSPHWCPSELVQYGWGHYSSQDSSPPPPPAPVRAPSAQSRLTTNKVQPAPWAEKEPQVPSSGEESQEEAETRDVDQEEEEKSDESLEPDMMVTLCESPHRFLATLDDDLSLDLPSVPM